MDKRCTSVIQYSESIEAGRVWVNQYHSYPAGAPLEDTNNPESEEKIIK
jgi:acyl-CoA reductase-like NAD-dependent aldehyde dehydrogenase